MAGKGKGKGSAPKKGRGKSASPSVSSKKSADLKEAPSKARLALEAKELAESNIFNDKNESDGSSEVNDESSDEGRGAAFAEMNPSDDDDDDDENEDDSEDDEENVDFDSDDEDDEEGIVEDSDSDESLVLEDATTNIPPPIQMANLNTTSTPKTESTNERTIKEQREMEGELASSDEEVEYNTTGDVPLEWYTKNFDHIGYDRSGKKIIAKGDGDDVSRALLSRGESQEAKDFRRSVYDARNDQVTILTDRELLMVTRMLEGKFPHPEFESEPDYVPYYSGVPMKTSLVAEHEPKRRFIPSKWERMKVERIVRGIEEGKIRMRTKEEEEQADRPNLYMLWGEDGDVDDKEEMLRRRRRTGGHVPAPKETLPGHKMSYHPPAEYLLNDTERTEAEKEGLFIPQDLDRMRRVGGYSGFVKERFERCLDLYLCARKTKVKLNIDPESLVPRLPLPRELRPFPTTNAVQYLGHTGKVRSTAVDPSGELLATGGDDGDVRLWDIQSGRCLTSFRLSTQETPEGDAVPVVRLAWNPKAKGVVAAACGSEIHICFAGVTMASAVDKAANGECLQTTFEKSVELLKGIEGENEDRSEEEVAHERKLVAWDIRSKIDSPEDLAEGSRPSVVVLKLTGGDSVIDLAWHGKGDFLCSVAVSSTKTAGRVLVHHVPKRRTQEAMKKLKGDPQAAVFHPDKPVIFVATKTHIIAYHLTKQATVKRLRAGVKWISTMAIHPKGDHLVIGSYDCRVVWFDLDLSSKPFKVMKYHTKAVRRVCFHRRYPLMASASDDGTINVFHTTVYDDYTRNPLIVPVKRIEAHDVVGGRGALDAVFHPTQPWIFTAGADGMTVLFSNIP